MQNIEIPVLIQAKYKDRIVAAFRDMKPYLPTEMTDLQVFQYRVKRMIRRAVISSEIKAAKRSVIVPDDLTDPEVDVVIPI